MKALDFTATGAGGVAVGANGTGGTRAGAAGGKSSRVMGGL
jgi:hypothetical protein